MIIGSQYAALDAVLRSNIIGILGCISRASERNKVLVCNSNDVVPITEHLLAASIVAAKRMANFLSSVISRACT